jgi:hypothetical protein
VDILEPGFQRGHAIAVDPSSMDLYVASFNNPAAGQANVELHKLDAANGAQAWTRDADFTGWSVPWGVSVRGNGGAFLAGNTAPTVFDPSLAFVAAYDSSGNLDWQDSFGGGVNAAALGITTVDNGGGDVNAVAVGYALGWPDTSNSHQQAWVRRYCD